MGSIVSSICRLNFLRTNTGFWAPSNLFFEVAFYTWRTNTNNHFLDAHCLLHLPSKFSSHQHRFLGAFKSFLWSCFLHLGGQTQTITFWMPHSTHHCSRCPISINHPHTNTFHVMHPAWMWWIIQILHRKNHQNFQPTGMKKEKYLLLLVITKNEYTQKWVGIDFFFWGIKRRNTCYY